MLFLHNQSTPSTTWTIAHNMGTQFVATDVTVSGEKLLPLNVKIVDADNIVIEFTNAQVGKATIISTTTPSLLG